MSDPPIQYTKSREELLTLAVIDLKRHSEILAKQVDWLARIENTLYSVNGWIWFCGGIGIVLIISLILSCLGIPMCLSQHEGRYYAVHNPPRP